MIRNFGSGLKFYITFCGNLLCPSSRAKRLGTEHVQSYMPHTNELPT